MNLIDEVSSKRERSEEAAMDSETIKNLLETGVLDVFRWEDDDLALRAAASHSRLPYDRMTAQEIGCFSDIAESKASLQMWQLESNVELTTEDSFEAMPIPYNSDRSLVRRIHGFLQRYGFINFGNFHRLTSCKVLVGSKKKRVIVIGAGAAGIAAAKQLLYFGFDVAVIEARKRVGGRVHTYRQRDSNIVADLGAMIVTGINGNPMVTIMRQVQCTPVRIKTPCAIYDEYGKLVDQRKDELVEEAFKKIGDTAAYIAHHLHIDEIDGEKLSLADAYDNIISLLELRMQRRRLKFWELYEEVLMKMKQVQDEMILYKKSAEYLAEKMRGMETMSSLSADTRIEQEILRKCYRRDLGEAIKRYDAASERVKSLDMTLSNLKKQEPSEVYMNQRDRRLLDFHFANLEFANGTNLEQLSLKHWDQDDDFELSGSHMAFRDGYGELITRLVTAELNERIQLNSVVELIEYDKNGVSVTYRHDGHLEKIHGDVCICTLPLGVLKRSVRGATEAPEFSPPLPDTKIRAIEEMGFGNLNKIVLIFDRPFWDTTQNFFGHLNHSKVARGEMFLFVSMFNTPVLIALMAGEAANLEAPNEIIVKKAMSVLANIFGSACPKGPLEAVITRWHNDPYATGCYSYIAKDTDGSGSQLDILAETVCFRIKDGSYAGEPRLYFAGEHTNKCYPATVQGAWMSGIREAAKIADLFLGCPFSRKTVLADPECVLLDSDDDSESCKDNSSITVESATEMKVNGHADQTKSHKSTKTEESVEEINGIKVTENEERTEKNRERSIKEEIPTVIDKEVNGEPEAKRRKED